LPDARAANGLKDNGEGMTGFAEYLADLVRRIAGVAAAMLPQRWWPALDEHIPVTSSALAAGLITLVTGALLGSAGFLTFATEQASLNTQAMLTAATSGRPEAEEVTTAMPVAANSLSLFVFLLWTPTGWASMYLTLTGLVRAAGAGFDDPRGDPILSLADAASLRVFSATRARRAQSRRESLEGPDVPDRVVVAATLGIPNADLVVVAARRKPGWDAGAVVLTSHAAFRLGGVTERQIDGRLRTLYPLTEHRDLEVFRRTVRYELVDPRSDQRL
jgi:nucleotide-binding universal stress UspA family protein